MKKLLAFALTLASFGFIGLGAEAKANAATSASTPQIRVRIGPQRNRGWRNRDWNRYNRTRTVRQTRVVRYGRHLYRETYAVRYFGNGQTSTTLISRERIS
jgi:hypothetical protein